MRYQQAYARRQRAVTFTRSPMRTVTIPLNPVDFERLERLAAKHNIGNATLGRDIIRINILESRSGMNGLKAVEAKKAPAKTGGRG